MEQSKKYNVTGSVKTLPDLDLITKTDSLLTDLAYDYYPTTYQFSDFKNIVLLKNFTELDRSPVYSDFWPHTKEGIDQCFIFLVNFYKDLDTNLTRLKDKKNDPMFIRFICKIGSFTTPQHWQLLIRNWNRGFSFAIARYYKNAHLTYSFDAISYLAYFDMFFSNYLYYAIGRSDQYLSESLADIDLRCEQQYRLEQLNPNYLLNTLVVE